MVFGLLCWVFSIIAMAAAVDYFSMLFAVTEEFAAKALLNKYFGCTFFVTKGTSPSST